jgi:hypothetical protein
VHQEIGRDASSPERLRSDDVACGRSHITSDDERTAHSGFAKEAQADDREIHGAGQARGDQGWRAHG